MDKKKYLIPFNLIHKDEKNTEMNENLESLRIFSKNGWFPPMFGENFRESGPEWTRIANIDFDLHGRILFCHLIIEHYLMKVIELSTPNQFDWSGARLTFSQKLKLLSKIDGIGKEFIKGIEIINKIRNNLSHNLQVKIHPNDITELKNIIKPFAKNTVLSEMDFGDNDIIILEIFTTATLSGLAAYCSHQVKDPEKPVKDKIETKI